MSALERAAEMINYLEGQGVRLSLAGDKIQFRGQASRVSPEQRETLAAMKPQLISFLIPAALKMTFRSSENHEHRRP